MRKIHYSIMVLSCMLLLCSLIHAVSLSGVTAYFETGKIDISLTQQQDKTVIMPGDEIFLIPEVCNKGNDCYVRTKLSFSRNEISDFVGFTGISDRWIEGKDGYWYFKDILSHGDSIKIFDSIKISSDGLKMSENEIIKLNTKVEAVQSENFVPDFDSEEPWKDVEILKLEKKNLYGEVLAENEPVRSIEVKYEGKISELKTDRRTPEIYFSEIMPGDEIVNEINFSNDSNHSRSLFFKSEVLNDSILNDELELEILFKDELVYSGKLKDGVNLESTYLGTLNKGEEGAFIFKVNAPVYIKNEYATLNSKIRWTFSTDEIELAKTRDKNDMHLYVMGSFISAILFTILNWERRKCEEEKNA